jgi:hypothetical protein
MKTLLLCIALLGGMPSTATASPDPRSGNAMLTGCKRALTEQADAKSYFCMGVVDTLRTMRRFYTEETTFCSPPEVTTEQLLRVTIKFMEEHPDLLDRSFIILALASYQRAWPCKK